MTTSTSGEFTVGTSVPEAFYLLDPADTAQSVDSWGLTIDENARSLLALAADRVSIAVRHSEHPDRLVWILIRTPELGRVDAVLTLDVHRALAGETIESLEIALGTSQPLMGTIDRKVSRQSIAAGEALIVHDFEEGPDEGGGTRRVTERAYVALFPTADVLLAYRLITQDLMLFDDIVTFLLEVAGQASIDGAQ